MKQKNVHVRFSPNLKKMLVTLIAVYGFWLATGFTLPVNVQARPPYPRDWSADSQVNPLTEFNLDEGKWTAVIAFSMEDRFRKPWSYAYGNILCTSDRAVLKQLQSVAFHVTPADVATVTSGLYLYKDGKLMYETGIVLEDGEEGLQNRDHGWMPPVQRGALHAVCQQFRRSWVPVVIL
ncbi:MAG TPA: hypothetical protein VLE43_07445 [Candidatus Saccharimonadia bacterium]|nr:hypothetical protein [Candidatus Saccharimonadia bacterium]